jgi:DNA-binding GntR family transcriptional regulator
MISRSRPGRVTPRDPLTRYVSDLVSRCSLVLAGDPRPHSSECAISEHIALIEHLLSGGAKAAQGAMADHLRAVGGRALVLGRRRATSLTELANG